MKSALLSLLCVSIVTLSCKNDGGSGGDTPLYTILPLDVGYTWTYEIKDSIEGQQPSFDTLVLIVIADTVIQGQHWHIFNQSIPAVGLPTGLVSNRSTGVFARVGDTQYLLMKYPVIVGESWLPVDGCEIEVSADSAVSVPAGSYAAVTYRLQCEDSVDVVEATAAVDVGIVLIRHWRPYAGELERVTGYRLVSFDLATGLAPGTPRRVF